MANVVYIHAFTTDGAVRARLMNFFHSITPRNAKGLTKISPVLNKQALDRLLKGHSQEFQDAAKTREFSGMGIWTEWKSPQHIDDYYNGSHHLEFSQFAKKAEGRAVFRVVQLREGKVKQREIK